MLAIYRVAHRYKHVFKHWDFENIKIISQVVAKKAIFPICFLKNDLDHRQEDSPRHHSPKVTIVSYSSSSKTYI